VCACARVQIGRQCYGPQRGTCPARGHGTAPHATAPGRPAATPWTASCSTGRGPGCPLRGPPWLGRLQSPGRMGVGEDDSVPRRAEICEQRTTPWRLVRGLQRRRGTSSASDAAQRSAHPKAHADRSSGPREPAQPVLRKPNPHLSTTTFRASSQLASTLILMPAQKAMTAGQPRLAPQASGSVLFRGQIGRAPWRSGAAWAATAGADASKRRSRSSSQRGAGCQVLEASAASRAGDRGRRRRGGGRRRPASRVRRRA